MAPKRHEPIEIDTRLAHSARVCNYLLGGKDDFAADRDAGDQMIAALPTVVSGSRMNRAFLARAVRYAESTRYAHTPPGNPPNSSSRRPASWRPPRHDQARPLAHASPAGTESSLP